MTMPGWVVDAVTPTDGEMDRLEHPVDADVLAAVVDALAPSQREVQALLVRLRAEPVRGRRLIPAFGVGGGSFFAWGLALAAAGAVAVGVATSANAPEPAPAAPVVPLVIPAERPAPVILTAPPRPAAPVPLSEPPVMASTSTPTRPPAKPDARTSCARFSPVRKNLRQAVQNRDFQQ